MRKPTQSTLQPSKTSSYRQSVLLTFLNRKLEDLYQNDFELSISNYRLMILSIVSAWLFSQIYDDFKTKPFFIFGMSTVRMILEIKCKPKKYVRILINGVSLFVSLFFLASNVFERQLDFMYYHVLALMFHYIFMSYYPINILIGLLIQFCFQDPQFFKNSLFEYTILYFLNKRSRDLFSQTDSVRKQHKTFQLMVENSPNGIFVVDMHHRIHYCNSQAKEILSKVFKNFSEKSSLGQNFMMLFDEKYHEKLNQAIFDCTGKHETIKLFQIPLISKLEVLSPIIEPNTNTLVSPKNLSLSRSTLNKTQFTTRYAKSCNFYNISVQDTFWKGGHFFMVSLENQEKNNRLNEISENCMSLINGLLQEIMELMEKDYQKWNNFQAIKVIREPDLKDLASIVVECNRIKGLVATLKNINQLALQRNERAQHKFNIRNTLVQCMELISIKAIERKIELLLKFEESFPEYVYGEYEHFKQLIHCILRIINLTPTSSSPKKPSKFTLFCKLNRYSEEGRFILTFRFEYESNDYLDDFFKDLAECDNNNPKEPFNYEYIIKHSGWSLDQMSLIPLMILLSAEINPHKMEEKPLSLVNLEVSFDTSDQHLMNSIDKSQAHSSPGVSLLNKRPLQLSFCRISLNVNNVVWREKPQAVLAASKQQAAAMPHKKKNVHLDFMKTSVKANLVSQLDKENTKEKESLFRPPNLQPNGNNLSITTGTPSFEFIKKDPDEANPNISSSPSWKEEDLLGSRDPTKQMKDHINSRKASSKDLEDSNRKMDSKESIKDSILLTKSEQKEPKKPQLSNEMRCKLKDKKEQKDSIFSGYAQKPPIGPFSPQNKLDIPSNIKVSVPSFKGKNDMVFSQISEKEIETSKHSSARDLKDEFNSMENSIGDKKKNKNQLELINEKSIIILPENVIESLDLLNVQLKEEFESLVHKALFELIRKHCPERLGFNETRMMKRNFSDMALAFHDMPAIESPKSSLIGNKKKKKKDNENSHNKPVKKFSFRNNIIKSLAKRMHKFSFSNTSNEECPHEPHSSRLRKKTSKSLSIQWNVLGYPYLEMTCFSCQQITQRRRWTKKKLMRRTSFEINNILIIGRGEGFSEIDFNEGTYLRSLLNKNAEEARVNVYFVQGFDHIDGYLNMKVEKEEQFSHVFLEESDNIEEIRNVVKKYRECENKANRLSKSEIILIGKNSESLTKIKDSNEEIKDILMLEASDEDWPKLVKILKL